MAEKDSKVLISVNDRLIAGDVQNMLENSGIFSVLVSDNPASSVMNAYMGSHPSETVELVVNILDYQKAIEIVSNSQYKELIINS